LGGHHAWHVSREDAKRPGKRERVDDDEGDSEGGEPDEDEENNEGIDDGFKAIDPNDLAAELEAAFELLDIADGAEEIAAKEAVAAAYQAALAAAAAAGLTPKGIIAVADLAARDEKFKILRGFASKHSYNLRQLDLIKRLGLSTDKANLYIRALKEDGKNVMSFSTMKELLNKLVKAHNPKPFDEKPTIPYAGAPPAISVVLSLRQQVVDLLGDPSYAPGTFLHVTSKTPRGSRLHNCKKVIDAVTCAEKNQKEADFLSLQAHFLKDKILLRQYVKPIMVSGDGAMMIGGSVDNNYARPCNLAAEFETDPDFIMLLGLLEPARTARTGVGKTHVTTSEYHVGNGGWGVNCGTYLNV
jgi:hypothetical protein